MGIVVAEHRQRVDMTISTRYTWLLSGRNVQLLRNHLLRVLFLSV